MIFFSAKGQSTLWRLKSLRLWLMYTFPCYNYFVAGLTTPLFMLIPVVFIWGGIFPAVLNHTTITVITIYVVLTMLVRTILSVSAELYFFP